VFVALFWLLSVFDEEMESRGGEEVGAGDQEEAQEPSEEQEVFLTAVSPNDITDDSCKTFIFKNEGHTLGNALRFVISHYPEVKFCGHTIPHPSENELHLRIQTMTGESAVDVLRKGLQDLEQICEVTEETFNSAVDKWRAEPAPGGDPHPPSSEEDFQFQMPPPPPPPRHK